MVRQKQSSLQVRLRAKRESRPNSVSTNVCVICGKSKKLTVAQERRNQATGQVIISKSLCSCERNSLK